MKVICSEYKVCHRARNCVHSIEHIENFKCYWSCSTYTNAKCKSKFIILMENEIEKEKKDI
jgi:hypothetical protein